MANLSAIVASLDGLTADEMLLLNKALVANIKRARTNEAAALTATLKVGDRVRLQNIKPRHYEGREGTVSSLLSRGSRIAVTLDGDVLPLHVPASALAKIASAAAKRPEREIVAEIADVYAGLSPENLSCDGELPQNAVRAKSKRLNACLAELFAELGYFVAESDAYERARSRVA